jgi:hypothetical protein
LKLLLATKAPVSLFRREQLRICEDHTTDATLAFPVGNYVSADLGNYVSDNRLNLGNYVSADNLKPGAGLPGLADNAAVTILLANHADPTSVLNLAVILDAARSVDRDNYCSVCRAVNRGKSGAECRGATGILPRAGSWKLGRDGVALAG